MRPRTGLDALLERQLEGFDPVLRGDPRIERPSAATSVVVGVRARATVRTEVDTVAIVGEHARLGAGLVRVGVPGKTHIFNTGRSKSSENVNMK